MTSRLERLYRRLPPPAQDAALTLEGLRVRRSRYGAGFDSRLRQYESRAAWTVDDITAYRDARLRETLRRAVRDAPFYSTAAYASLDEVETLADLAAFPLLSKAEVRDAGDRLHAHVGPDEGGRVWAHTSGTTGAGLRFPTTTRATEDQWAVWWRYRRDLGLDLGQWSGYFGGRDIATGGRRRAWRVDRAQRRVLFSAYLTTAAHLDEAIDVIRRRRLDWLHGYPSFISLVAHRLLARDESLVDTVRWVTTGSENLGEHQRQAITAAFGVAPREHYGAAEAVANVSNCPSGTLHIDEDFSAVEIVDGELVGTGFSNPAFPLVRYRTGDRVVESHDVCPCRRRWRSLASIDGRLEDYLELADGSLLGRLDHVFKDAVRVRAAQFVQHDPGVATLRIAGTPELSEGDVDAIRGEVGSRTGDRLDLAVELVDEIPLTSAGKLRLVVRTDR